MKAEAVNIKARKHQHNVLADTRDKPVSEMIIRIADPQVSIGRYIAVIPAAVLMMLFLLKTYAPINAETSIVIIISGIYSNSEAFARHTTAEMTEAAKVKLSVKMCLNPGTKRCMI